MNNSDMPAMPNTMDPQTMKELHPDWDNKVSTLAAYNMGLTKREQMAIEFTKANIIGIYSTCAEGEFHNWNFDDFSREGLGQADSLLAALEAK